MTPEASQKALLTRLLNRLKAEYPDMIEGFKMVETGRSTNGYGDWIGCVAGYFVHIEVKAGKNKPTALQLHRRACVITARGRACIFGGENGLTVEELEKCLKTLLENPIPFQVW